MCMPIYILLNGKLYIYNICIYICIIFHLTLYIWAYTCSHCFMLFTQLSLRTYSHCVDETRLRSHLVSIIHAIRENPQPQWLFSLEGRQSWLESHSFVKEWAVIRMDCPFSGSFRWPEVVHGKFFILMATTISDNKFTPFGVRTITPLRLTYGFIILEIY